jgi:hypothetical protein
MDNFHSPNSELQSSRTSVSRASFPIYQLCLPLIQTGTHEIQWSPISLIISWIDKTKRIYRGCKKEWRLLGSRRREGTWWTLFQHSEKYSRLFLITRSNHRIWVWKTHQNSSKVTLPNNSVSASITSSKSTHLRFLKAAWRIQNANSHKSWDLVNRVVVKVFPFIFPIFSAVSRVMCTRELSI